MGCGGAHCPGSQRSAIVLAARIRNEGVHTVRVVSCGPEVDNGRCPNLGFFSSLDVVDMSRDEFGGAERGGKTRHDKASVKVKGEALGRLVVLWRSGS